MKLKTINLLIVMFSATAYADSYSDATSKAQEAFLVQSGINKELEALSNLAVDKMSRVISNPKDFATIAGAALMLGVKKQVNQSFKNPVWPNMKHTVNLSTDSQAIGLQIPF